MKRKLYFLVLKLILNDGKKLGITGKQKSQIENLMIKIKGRKLKNEIVKKQKTDDHQKQKTV